MGGVLETKFRVAASGCDNGLADPTLTWCSETPLSDGLSTSMKG